MQNAELTELLPNGLIDLFITYSNAKLVESHKYLKGELNKFYTSNSAHRDKSRMKLFSVPHGAAWSLGGAEKFENK